MRRLKSDNSCYRSIIRMLFLACVEAPLMQVEVVGSDVAVASEEVSDVWKQELSDYSRIYASMSKYHTVP